VNGRRTRVESELAAVTNGPTAKLDRRRVEKDLRTRLDEWRSLLGERTVVARQIVTKLLDGKIVLTPITIEDGTAAYELKANFTLGRFFSGILAPTGCPRGMASPTGFEPVFWP
jgi:hypothetical protein